MEEEKKEEKETAKEETKEEKKEKKRELIKVIDMKVSDKLQRNGFKVVEVTGGISNGNVKSPKAHYFDLTLEQAKNLRDASGSLVLLKEEIDTIVKASEIKSTRFC